MRIRKSTTIPTIARRYFILTICSLPIAFLLLRKTIINKRIARTSIEPLTLLPQSGFPSLPSLIHKPDSPPLVTLILTAYNVRPFIDHSLNASLSQTYQNLHIVIVDDASTDGTSQRIAQLTADDPRIEHLRLSSNTFGGVATPSNIGIEAAKGKYIAFVDGDDIPMPHFIENMVAVAEASNPDFVYCDFALFEDDPKKRTKAYDLNRWPSEKLIKLSQTRPFHPSLYPATFQLSPVPWRKLYRTEFLIENHIRFPEGDYFFEDNSFHWLVNIHAENISFLKETLVLHRTGRKSQTTSSLQTAESEKKVAIDENSDKGGSAARVRSAEEQRFLKSLERAQVVKFVPNCNYVGFRVAKCDDKVVRHCSLVRSAFLKWVLGSKWILGHVRSGMNEKLVRKASSVHARTVWYWLDWFGRGSIKWAQVAERPSSIDLSIVVPAYNIESFIDEFVEFVTSLRVRHEVIFVDDNSADGTLLRLKSVTEQYPNMHVLHTSGNGAGRARNLGLLFAEGEYVVFLDGDDAFHDGVLDSAVWQAKMKQLDVILLRYEIEYVRQGAHGGVEVRRSDGMFTEDERAWSMLRNETDVSKMKQLAGGMTNYPWTKVVKREFLMRENVFFGAGLVNNDVLYHWHTIFKSGSLGGFDGIGLVKHRKFDDRRTLTEERDMRRLHLLDGLAGTNRVLLENGLAQDQEFQKCWRRFVARLIKWGRGRVGSIGREAYETRAKQVEAIVNATADNRLLVDK